MKAGGAGFAQGAGRGVGRDGDFRMPPERVFDGQGLGAEHVERGPGQMAAVHQRDQVFFDQVLATCDIDEVAASLQARQGVLVQDVFGFGCERHQVDQNAAGLQKVMEL